MSSKIAIMSCAQIDWINSSKTMGDCLARAIGEGASCNVNIPIDSHGFKDCFSRLTHLIIHTHGDSGALYDQRSDGRILKIISMRGIEEMTPNRNLRFIMMTACSSAGGAGKNIASVLSTRISPKGIVIANRHVVWGADYDFGTKDGARGWVAYRNGEMILDENDIPEKLTMADAYNIAMSYDKNK